jgi:uncharacterized protein (DUF2267 family)
MKGEQFIAEVRNLAELDTNEDAEKVIRVTLETLRERLAGNEPSNLAAQLPPEIAPYVEGDGGRGPSPWRSSTTGSRTKKVSATTRPSGTPGRWLWWCRRP